MVFEVEWGGEAQGQGGAGGVAGLDQIGGAQGGRGQADQGRGVLVDGGAGSDGIKGSDFE